jgi:hypothetical protein
MMLAIQVSEPARSRALSLARAQAYAAAGPLADWQLLPEDLEPSYASNIGERAVVLIGAHPAEIAAWLNAQWAVIADGIWSTDPTDIFEVVNLAQRVGQPLIQGDELLHAPVLAGALTEAAEIGAITSCEFRSVHPRDAVVGDELLQLHAPSVVMRALLCLKMLWPTDLGATTNWDALDSTDSRSRGAPITIRGTIAPTSVSPQSRIHVSASTHQGRSVIQDLQFSSATGVVRAELLPTPRLEINGEPVSLPEATHSPAQLEWFGMISMLNLMRRAVTERTQPLTSPNLLATALQILAA